jgi:hypothetical protein
MIYQDLSRFQVCLFCLFLEFVSRQVLLLLGPPQRKQAKKGLLGKFASCFACFPCAHVFVRGFHTHKLVDSTFPMFYTVKVPDFEVHFSAGLALLSSRAGRFNIYTGKHSKIGRF